MAQNNLGLVYLDVRKNLKSAELNFRKAIEIDDSSADAHNNLGVVLKESGKYAEAERAYRRAIEIDSKCTSAHLNLGNLLRDQGDYDGAAEELQTAIALDPTDPNGYWDLSFVLEKKGDVAGAIKLVEECVRLRGIPGRNCEQRLAKLRAATTPAGKAYSEGIARRDEKKWPEAVAAFQNCVALDANHSEAWYELGWAYNYQTGSYKVTEASIKPYLICGQCAMCAAPA
jgi:tetratricopeptide (TPR) repeat protein